MKELLERFGVKPRGVVHVGAHEGQEIDDYGIFDHVLLIEPQPAYASALRQKGFPTRQVAAWHENATLQLHITSFDQGSSLLQPLEHETVETIEVEATPLRQMIDKRFNVAVIDVQGAELNVLRGADLNLLDLIKVETNTRQRYVGAPLHDEIVDYLQANGFELAMEIKHAADGVIRDCIFVRAK